MPPSTVRFAPLMNDDSGPATNATSAATSSACPYRPRGTAACWPAAHSPEAGCCAGDQVVHQLILGLFLLPPLRVKLRDRGTDGESPGINREVLELLRHDVPVLGFFRGHSRLEHLVRLRGDVVKDFAQRGEAALPAKLPMAWHEQRILVPRRKGLQRLTPPGNRRLLVEADGIQPAKQ